MFLNLQFPKANIKLIMEKVRDLIKPVYKQFVQELTPPESENGVFVIEYKDLRYYKFIFVKLYQYFHVILLEFFQLLSNNLKFLNYCIK